MTPTIDEVIRQIDRYFSNTNRTQQETAEGLERVQDHILILLETLDET